MAKREDRGLLNCGAPVGSQCEWECDPEVEGSGERNAAVEGEGEDANMVLGCDQVVEECWESEHSQCKVRPRGRTVRARCGWRECTAVLILERLKGSEGIQKRVVASTEKGKSGCGQRNNNPNDLGRENKKGAKAG